MDASKPTPTELVEQNLKLAVYVVKRFFYWVKLNDERIDYLATIGYEGLWKAALNWDSTRGIKFSTYACKCIYNVVRRFLDKHKDLYSRPEGTLYLDQRGRRSLAVSEDMRPQLVDAPAQRRLEIEEECDYLRDQLERIPLSKLEREVINLKLRGLSRVEICQAMEMTTNQLMNVIDNAYNKLRGKPSRTLRAKLIANKGGK